MRAIGGIPPKSARLRGFVKGVCEGGVWCICHALRIEHKANFCKQIRAPRRWVHAEAAEGKETVERASSSSRLRVFARDFMRLGVAQRGSVGSREDAKGSVPMPSPRPLRLAQESLDPGASFA